MKRLKLLICIFFIALSIPLAYFILLAYQGIEQEEMAELQYFATTLFDKMEEELAALILREEKRSLDEYSYYLSTNSVAYGTGFSRSPLSGFPKENYILGYLQNNPDGSFQTPLVESGKTIPDDRRDVTERLKNVNVVLNTLEIPEIPEKPEVQPVDTTTRLPGKKISSIAEKYLDLSRLREQKTRFEQERRQTQRVTMDQVLNVAQDDQKQKLIADLQEEMKNSEQDTHVDSGKQADSVAFEEQDAPVESESQIGYKAFSRSVVSSSTKNLHVDVGLMQSVLINDHEILIFRRIVIDTQVYRQGFVIFAQDFLNHLKDTYFSRQPIAEFANLRLEIIDQEYTPEPVQTGASTEKPILSLNRVFPGPFSFLQATIICDQLPGSTGRRILNIMRVLIGVIMLSGLFAIYQSVRTMVDLSERRSLFVSSVTHELKTPLTNIRMYIEMLEQGIAPTREREEEYFRILGSESSRLSRLIDNVLEFSKLEKKQRRFNLQEGTFEEVIREVRDIMQEKFRQEGFILKVERGDIRSFRYDREVMVQVLLNLIENSIKFGKASPVREITLRLRSEGNQVKISVSDTGPGIPRSALKKIFDDFYRVENDSTQITRGTGIGLALVKKFVTALDGTVEAVNNKETGCTITISLPACVPIR